jgi:hypothetical protein
MEHEREALPAPAVLDRPFDDQFSIVTRVPIGV